MLFMLGGGSEGRGNRGVISLVLGDVASRGRAPCCAAYRPPAIAGIIDISSPDFSAVAAPLRKRTSSPFT